MKLTNALIAKFKYDKSDNKQDIRWDDDMPGFGVRVYPTGNKSYVVAYRVRRRRYLQVVGAIEDFDLAVAREQAREILREVARTGQPPKQLEKTVLGDLFSVYIDRHARHMRSSSEEIRRLNRHFISRWSKRRVEDVGMDEILRLHARISKEAPVEANRVIQLYRRIINRGKEWGYVRKEFPNPVDEIIENPERKRDRWVNPDEMPKLLDSINRVENVYVRSVLWLYLLTGARKNELLKAKHADYDKAAATLRILDSKNGEERYLYLSSLAVEILDELPKLPNNPYLFPGRNHGCPLTNIFKTWRNVREKAGLPDVTIHDLRRTAGSWLAQQGCSLYEIAEILGHKDIESTKIYSRFSGEHLRNRQESYSSQISTLCKTLLGGSLKTDNE